MIKSISATAHYAVASHANAAFASFVGTHNGTTRPDVGGYNLAHKPADLDSCSLQAHRASESIQDKSQDARLSICHMPA
jgi:hypothetical protein